MSPGDQGDPYPKLKTPRIWPTIFLGETQVHVQKQTKIKMNVFDSPKLGGRGRRPTAFKLWGQVAPTAPPPPAPVCLIILMYLTVCKQFSGKKHDQRIPTETPFQKNCMPKFILIYLTVKTVNGYRLSKILDIN